jgi:pimeloyl-ACP methyl ester carboxylesterase
MFGAWFIISHASARFVTSNAGLTYCAYTVCMMNSDTPTNLRYDTVGDSGRDWLLLHGWGSSRRMWDRPVREFSKAARCWMVDLPGFGDSPLVSPDGNPGDLDHYTDALAEFCVQKNIRPQVVIGHSMGGLLTLKLALAHPELMERLVLVSPVVSGRFLTLGLGRLLARYPARALALRLGWLWTLVQSPHLAPIMALPWVTNPSVKARVYGDMQRVQWPAALTLLSLASQNLTPRLHEIQQPTLVLVGTRDLTVPPSEGRLAARLIPNAQLVEFPRTYHQLVDEQPERFIEAVRTFLYSADANYDTMRSLK